MLADAVDIAHIAACWFASKTNFLYIVYIYFTFNIIIPFYTLCPSSGTCDGYNVPINGPWLQQSGSLSPPSWRYAPLPHAPVCIYRIVYKRAYYLYTQTQRPAFWIVRIHLANWGVALFTNYMYYILHGDADHPTRVLYYINYFFPTLFLYTLFLFSSMYSI